MTVQLLLAPAGAGKTAYAVAEARCSARGLTSSPQVLVASALQAQSFRRRLARAGGAIGVRVLTFQDLYRLCLGATDAVYSEISDAVQQRVIRSVVRELTLTHYAPLMDRPGFFQVLKDIIDELKAARVHPQAFADAVAGHGDAPRLRELAEIYASYQARLQAERWADPAGLGWLAVEALESGGSEVGTDWPLLLVDGFDDFTPVQLALLSSLAGRVARTVITLTGSPDGARRSLVHRRFERTCQEVAAALGVEPEPLSEAGSRAFGEPDRAPVLVHLEAELFESNPSRMACGARIELIEAPNRAAEVRAAMRWLKAEIVERGVSPGKLALLARDVAPYSTFVRQIGAEFGLAARGSAPVRAYAGEPLHRNPAVAALMDLLRLMLPAQGAEASGAGTGADEVDGGEPSQEPKLPPRLVSEAWRCPYFDWSAEVEVTDSASARTKAPIGIEAGDADALDQVARRGRVIAGLGQWQAAFEAVGARAPEPAVEREEVEPGWAPPGRTPLTRQRVRALEGTFRRFVRRLTPPEGRRGTREYVRWLETLIGPDPAGSLHRSPRSETRTSLDVVGRVRAGESAPGAEPVRRMAVATSSYAVERDLAALRCLKTVLQGLVWAEEALGDPPVTFSTFFGELTRAVEAAFYKLAPNPEREEILFADVVAARGVPFESVAVVGLAEGFFPAPQNEDPLLHDEDREELELPLEASTRSAEAEYFYEAVAAASQRILLTRPRLTEDGAPWQPSPFWEEVRRLVDGEPTMASGTRGPAPHRVASWPELLLAAAGPAVDEELSAWLRQNGPAGADALEASAQVLTLRRDRANSPFDGGLQPMGDHFTAHFHPGYTWSASRLEAYTTCPFYFFVGHVLGLEPREEPAEGVDWLQRGNLYHEILERIYQRVEDPTDLGQLLDALRDVAGEVLDRAPEEQGFRETAWWEQTRREMVEDVRRSLEALCDEEVQGDYAPLRHEAAFGLWGEPPLVVRDAVGEDGFVLRGLIDRVDRDPEGRLRVIDYKTGGPSSYGKRALRDGEKIQLPLYALAARDALGLGEPASGFYWHVRHAEASPLKLEDVGPEEAIGTAVAHAWEAIRSARAGAFAPQVPKGGCPPYCGAVGFCWHYEPRYR